MVRRAGFVIAALFIVSSVSAEPNDNSKVTHTACFLRHGSGGHVWITEPPVIPLGMYASALSDYVTRTRLRPELEEAFAPLTNRFLPSVWADESRNRVDRSFPRPVEEEDPVILVTLESESVLDEEHLTNKRLGTSESVVKERIYEVRSARLVNVEFISPEWRRNWARLDEALTSIVAETLTAPGEEKRRRVKDLIDEGSRALNVMTSPEIREEWREIVRQMGPEVEIVTRHQKSRVQQWGDPFARCVGRLAIEPATPLPVQLQPRDDRAPEKAEEPISARAEEVGLVGRAIGRKEMAEKLILGGILIEQVVDGKGIFMIREGDILLTCTRVYDLVMYGDRGIGGYMRHRGEEENLRKAMEGFVNRARRIARASLRPERRSWERPPRVLRGDTVLEIAGP
jgi:hypothetical protein